MKVGGILADIDEQAERNNQTRATAYDWVIATLNGDKPHAEFGGLMQTLLWLACRREGRKGKRAEKLMKQGGNTLCYWFTKHDDRWDSASAIYPSIHNPTSEASLLAKPKGSSLADLPFDTLRQLGLPGLPGGPALKH
jgi:hypothetical protein